MGKNGVKPIFSRNFDSCACSSAILGISELGSSLRVGGFGAGLGVIMEIEEITVIVVVPLLIGLIWNRWAGGASEFLTSARYSLGFLF